jgi:hypothetical protein
MKRVVEKSVDINLYLHQMKNKSSQIAKFLPNSFLMTFNDG